MPLPTGNTTTAWPPLQYRNGFEDIDVWDAWYAGDIEKLEWLYATNRLLNKTSLWGQVRRRFFGTPTPLQSSQVPVKTHVPLPASIAAMSRSLLLEEMPTFLFVSPTGDGDSDADDVISPAAAKANARLEELLDDDAHEALGQALELTSAHGGSYVRVTWDKQVIPDRPFLAVTPAAAAIPDFRHGRLTGVTFSETLPTPDGENGTWRLLERHEPGTIEWGLFQSQAPEALGTRLPLTEHPQTKYLAQVVDQNSTVKTGSDLLTAVYLPNLTPNRKRRTDPVAKNYGRSDFDGVEDLFDALDEAVTSLMRDLRLGKARIMVPDDMLTSLGAGKGAVFNEDQEVFTALKKAAGSAQNQQSFINLYQPNIRASDHLSIIAELINEIYTAAGYSPQTFGDESAAGVRTATEISAKEKLTALTRSKKITVLRGRLATLAAAMLDVDRFAFNGPGRPAGMLPDVEWQDDAGEDAFQQAQQIQLLYQAESISTFERVKWLHPDWDDEQIDTEVHRIRDEFGPGPFEGAGYFPAASVIPDGEKAPSDLTDDELAVSADGGAVPDPK